MTELFEGYPDEVLEKFKRFHSDNRHIYEEFKALSFKMKHVGRAKYSARTIIEVMRWNHEVKTKGNVFKINGDFVPIYVRLLIHNHPEMKAFFELRRVRSLGVGSRYEKRLEESEWPMDRFCDD